MTTPLTLLEATTPLAAAMGRRIRARRRAMRLTQSALAEALHIPQSHLCQLELGRYRRLPPIPTLVRLAQMLGLSTDALLGLVPLPGHEPIGETDEAVLNSLDVCPAREEELDDVRQKGKRYGARPH